MSTDEKDHDPKKTPPHKQVVVTHYGKKKKTSDDDVPPEIAPTTPSHIVSSPVDVGLTPQSSSSEPKPQLPPNKPKEPPVPPPPAAKPPVYIPPIPSFTSQEEVSARKVPPPLHGSTFHERTYAASSATQGAYMNDPSEQATESDTTGSAGGGGGASLFFSLIATSAAIGLMVYAYFSKQQLDELQLQAQNDKTSVEAIANEAKKSLEQLDELKAKHLAQQKSLQVLKTQLEGAQSRLVDLAGKNEWVLSEANYLAFMANERLRAAQDVSTALTQLQEADNRLATLSNPAFNWVREVLAKDIAKLESHPRVNRQSLWENIAQLNLALNQLHFKTLDTEPLVKEKETSIDKDAPQWRKMLWRSWQELKGLISVTRETNNPIPQALTAQDQDQILRTMQLTCDQAQWAVLQGDTKIYLSSLQSLRNLVQKYFDVDVNSTTLLTNIQRLEQQRVDIPLPDISDSIRALSQAMLDVNKKTQAPPAQPVKQVNEQVHEGVPLRGSE